MTCVVAVVSDGRVVMGADSAGVSGYDLRVRTDHKVFNNGPYVLGFTTSFRMGQLLRYAFKPPIPAAGADVAAFMATTFVNQVRLCLKEGGYAAKHDERESAGTFLVGFCGRIFKIVDDYQVGESDDGFDACGCGESYALGALSALFRYGMHPRECIIRALGVAESFSAGVRGPYHLVEEAP